MQTPVPDNHTAAVTAALIAAVSSFVVLVLTAFIAQTRFLYEKRVERESLLNGLFGEMANICEHYLYIKSEFAGTASWSSEETIERLQLARYGEVLSTADFGRYGFLNAEDIRLLLQLRLRIRNNDLILTRYMKHVRGGTPVNLDAIPGRAIYASGTANDVMQRLAGKRRRLQNTLDALKREVPGIR